jgi:hypothetical protein
MELCLYFQGGLLSHNFQLAFFRPNFGHFLNLVILNFFCLVLKPTSKTIEIGQFLNVSYSTTMK